MPCLVDEGVVLDPLKILNAETVTLEVIDTSLRVDATEGTEKEVEEESAWVLDICLDYFSTCNPFILELRTRLNPAQE
jgi:hypothetical protein